MRKLAINDVDITLIESVEEMDNVIPVIYEANEIAVDTEFDKFRYRYGFNICLLQLFDGKDCYIFDTIKIKPENLKPLWDILEDKSILKIFQSCDEDIRLFKGYLCNPQNIFDNGLAAQVLNYPKSSLKYLLLEKLGVDIDKSEQKSNWNKRPLTDSQIIYSAIDVIYLHKIKNILHEELIQAEGNKQFNFLTERLLQLKENYLKEHLEKIISKTRMSEHSIQVMRAIYDFRDKAARKYDLPPHFIFSDTLLKDISIRPDFYIENWMETKGVFRGIKNISTIEYIIDALKTADENIASKKKKHRHTGKKG